MTIWRILYALFAAAASAYAFLAPPAEGFAEPQLARLIFWHLPCAFIAAILLVVAGVQGIKVLRGRPDGGLAASLELGAMFATLTILSGMIFARVQWGHYWHWDPRQTSFLIVTLLFFGALAVRGGFREPEKRAKASAAYAVAMMVPGIFLTFVYPRLPVVKQRSVHPDVMGDGGFDRSYWLGILALFIAIGIAVNYAYRLRARAATLEGDGTADPGAGADRGDANGAGVVRPVALHQASEKEDRS